MHCLGCAWAAVFMALDGHGLGTGLPGNGLSEHGHGLDWLWAWHGLDSTLDRLCVCWSGHGLGMGWDWHWPGMGLDGQDLMSLAGLVWPWHRLCWACAVLFMDWAGLGMSWSLAWLGLT